MSAPLGPASDHTHVWRAAITRGNGVEVYCEVCNTTYAITEYEAADYAINGDAYKAAAKAAAAFITDTASMDAAGRMAAFDNLLEAVKNLPDETRYGR